MKEIIAVDIKPEEYSNGMVKIKGKIIFGELEINIKSNINSNTDSRIYLSEKFDEISEFLKTT